MSKSRRLPSPPSEPVGRARCQKCGGLAQAFTSGVISFCPSGKTGVDVLPEGGGMRRVVTHPPEPEPMAQFDRIRIALGTILDPSLREAALKDLSDVVATMKLTNIRFIQLNGMIALDERGNPATQTYIDSLLERGPSHASGRYVATRPLQTEQDYHEAKARLEKIPATVARGTPEGDELELLSLLISDWENV